MGETEVTNAVMAAVLQWAYNSGRFSSIVGDHNYLDSTTAKYGGQQLLDLDDTNCRVYYDGDGAFSAESGFENKPVTNVTWYGSVMFCNWLTEMRDGNTDNLIYTNIDTDWASSETLDSASKTGYRLPYSVEFEYAARYLGSSMPSSGGSLDTEYVSLNYNDDGTSSLTDGYFWTPGDYASGAIEDYTNTGACQTVAVYEDSSPKPTDEASVKSLGAGSANVLGIYDMCGNVRERMFDEHSSGSCWIQAGGWSSNVEYLKIGDWVYSLPVGEDQGDSGFRLCRTAD